MAKKSKGKKSGDQDASARTRRVEAAFDPVNSGILLAGVVAGPSLWSLYDAGDLDLVTALLHGGLVAAGCGIGVAGINRLIADFRVQADRDRRIQQVMNALDGVVHEGLPIQPGQQPPHRPPR